MKNPTINTIVTPRLILREVNPEVYEFAFQTYSDSQLKEFFGFTSDKDLAEEKDRHKKGVTTFNKSFLYFHLIEKSNNTFLGWCGYHTWYTPHLRAEMGYWINDESQRKKGFMKEAIIEIIKYGFEKMNLNRIEAFVGPDNVPSLTLIKSTGFKEEGRLREHYRKSDKIEDSIVFSLLKREYIV